MAVSRLVFITLCAVYVAGSELSPSVTISDTKVNSIPNEHNLTLPVADGTDYGMRYVFDSMRLMGLEVLQNQTELTVSARMKMSDMMFNPVMLVPQLIMWGFAPILLANLKMFVMQALMLNKMALSSAIFMTLRNIVFGPRPGPVVKYANYGYGHGENKVHHYHDRS